MSLLSGRDAVRAKRLVLAGMMALATSGSPALAEDHATWRCNTPYATYDQNDLPIGDRTMTISGEIAFHKADFGDKWASLAKIGFKDQQPEGGGCYCNGIEVRAFKDKDKDKGEFEFHVVSDGLDRPIAQSPFDTPIGFKIALSPEGVMTVTIGRTNPQTIATVITHLQHNKLAMACSGADVSFLNIDVQ